ncbi:MAG: domain nuclease [Hydrocarboniphaga sp.]|uniref:type II toxin-antitoxin system VapC family toxin n=1 Tax=Hydrocarboniphaga sp. TaxID=2033016 RepID=UPI002610078D|nr:type II toxin-antitoxin system VapC family toxin [Hydrocarboniphaga sp.]MDB5969353.1 domain nuclease [Hydrocarboniphaga sp.]
MKLLLDTHSFLWLDAQPQEVSAAALAACESPDNELYLSLVSAWEIQIKTQLNKLSLRVPLEQMIQVQQADNGLQILPITLPHIRELSSLPLHHKDPFDRLLIAQARIEGAYLVSADGVFKDYPVNRLW